MAYKGPYEFPHYWIGLSTDTKPAAPIADIGDEFFETNTRLWYIYDGSTWSQKITSAVGSGAYTTSTNPAGTPTFAAVTTVIVDAYAGVIITTTTTGNAQTIQNPTIVTAGKTFTVVNNDTSTNSIAVNGITITPGEAQSFIWDGSAWGPIDIGITALPVTVAQGGTGLSTITDHGVMVGSGTGAVTPLAVGATGEILVGATGADPAWSATPSITTSLTVPSIYGTTADNGVLTLNGTSSATKPTSNVVIQSTAGTITVGTATPAASSKLTLYDSDYLKGLTIGDDIATADNAKKGLLILPYTDGSLYFECKTHTGGLINFQSGAGTDLGNARTWMSVNPTTGVVSATLGFQGKKVITTHSATENVTAASLYGDTHVVTGAYVVSLPTAAVGYHASFYASTAAVYSIDLVTGTDVIVLNGTALTAGYKATSDGTIYNEMFVECRVAGKYTINSVVGLAIDGGA